MSLFMGLGPFGPLYATLSWPFGALVPTYSVPEFVSTCINPELTPTEIDPLGRFCVLVFPVPKC